MEKSRKSAPSRRSRKKANADVAAAASFEPPPAPLPPSLPGAALSVPDAALATPGRDMGAALEPRFPAYFSHELPLALCAVNQGHAAVGLAVVLVARRLGPAVVCAHFVIDLLAAGVTECYGEAFDEDGFAGYIDDMDARVALETCPIEKAAELIALGVARGRAHGFPEPDSLAPWSRMIPPVAVDLAAAERTAFGPAGRPLVVAEMLTSMRLREARAALREQGEPICVVRATTPREH